MDGIVGPDHRAIESATHTGPAKIEQSKAVEEQAIDRTYRIGQKRNVFAYKMICKDSVEEKILQLQQRKKMLADDLIQEDSNFVKTLNREDVEFLFG